jgi:hypothetical protein
MPALAGTQSQTLALIEMSGLPERPLSRTTGAFAAIDNES